MTVAALLLSLTSATLRLLSMALALPIFRYLSDFLWLLLVYGLVSAVWAKHVLRLHLSLSEAQILRGQKAQIRITVSHPFLIPVGRFSCELETGSAGSRLSTPLRLLRAAELTEDCPGIHVGVRQVRLTRAEVCDLFGLFRFRLRRPGEQTLTVLPIPFPIVRPTFSVSEEGEAALKQANEDLTSPDDTRPYQPGDPMKRIQWKLYARRHDLLVRRYESPMPRDTLILADCGKIEGGTGRIDTASLRDALCETAVAIADLQLRDDCPVRMPLYGENATEFTAEHGQSLLVLQELLARQTFIAAESFPRVLQMELKRVRRSGAVVMISTRLDASIVDLTLSYKQLGPNVRYYLVTDDPDKQEHLALVRQLQQSQVEVCYVTPAQ